MSEKQGLPVDNSLRSDNSTGSPKGHTRNLKFFYSSSEVTRTAPSPAPKDSAKLLFSVIHNTGSPRINELIVCTVAAGKLSAR